MKRLVALASSGVIAFAATITVGVIAAAPANACGYQLSVTSMTPMYCYGGTMLTFTGRGFNCVAEVLFENPQSPGTASATISSRTNTSLTAVVPIAPYRSTARVDLAPGSATSGVGPPLMVPGAFTYGPPPSPPDPCASLPISVSSMSPDSGSAGTTITLTGSNLDCVVEAVVGPNPATITSSSASSLSMTVPSVTLPTGRNAIQLAVSVSNVSNIMSPAGTFNYVSGPTASPSPSASASPSASPSPSASASQAPPPPLNYSFPKVTGIPCPAGWSESWDSWDQAESCNKTVDYDDQTDEYNQSYQQTMRASQEYDMEARVAATPDAKLIAGNPVALKDTSYVVTGTQKVYFEDGAAALDARAKTIADRLHSVAETDLLADIHLQASGPDASTRGKRLQAVIDYLTSHGVERSRIITAPGSTGDDNVAAAVLHPLNGFARLTMSR